MPFRRALTKKELQKEMKKREREEMRRVRCLQRRLACVAAVLGSNVWCGQFEEARREELKKKTEAKEEVHRTLWVFFYRRCELLTR